MEIFIARDGQREGPFPLDEVRRRLAAGVIQHSDLAWADGMADWTPVGNLPGLATAEPPPLSSAPRPVMPASSMRPVGSPAPTTSGLAVTSLVLGILSITILPILPAIPAVICGHVARAKIKQSAGALAGSGLALAGLITGYLGLSFIFLAFLAGLALPVFAQVQVRAKETQSLSNAKQIALACQLYALENKGNFPQTLEELVPVYLPDRKTLVCPLSGPTVPIGYEYFGGKQTDPPETVLLASKALSKGKRRVIAHTDASAELVRNPPPLPAR
jgi:hypothetical protein